MNRFLLENISDEAPQNSLKTQILQFSTGQMKHFTKHRKETNKRTNPAWSYKTGINYVHNPNRTLVFQVKT